MKDRLVVRKTELGQFEVALQTYCGGYFDKFSVVADSIFQAIELMAKSIEVEIFMYRKYLEELYVLPVEDEN